MMTATLCRSLSLATFVLTAFCLSACGGGGGGSTPPPPVTYTIGGTVFDISGSGLILQNNGGNSLPVTENGSFAFNTPVASGGSYSVTVKAQPSSPPQTCTVTNGSGTATANVSNIQVVCLSEWAWVGGPNTVNQFGVYGSLKTAAPNNLPGGREAAVSWTDSSGNFWLFGGSGLASSGNPGLLNDLWEYAGGEWTWISGANTTGLPGIYGTQGVAGVNNVPGARQNAASWTDKSGIFWLFGGIGIDSAGMSGNLNDLWKYADGQWIWVSGANVINQPAVYGTLGMPSSENVPGARWLPATWTDANGALWLFGGGSTGTVGNLNDLWKYSAGQWTWMGGSSGADQAGTYGTQGVAAANNIPGGRWSNISWTDAAGNFWLFGGGGIDSAGAHGPLNDLWKYSAGQWTWVGGSNLASQPGTYGSLGLSAASSIPGARYGSVRWIDADGKLWLLGGDGIDSTGASGLLNDLWKYDGGKWTWMSGSNLVSQPAQYGTVGASAPGNDPGARWESLSWADSAGQLWLFGGQVQELDGGLESLSDLWRYEP